MADPLATIVIPTRNAGSEFAVCLERVLAQRIDLPYDVLLVDSGSTDETLSLAARFPVRLLQVPPSSFNHGLTRNAGLEQAPGRWGVLLVQDAWPADEHWLATLLEPLRADETLAGAYSRQLPRPDAPPLVRYDLLASLAGQDQPLVHVAAPANQPAHVQRAAINFDDVSSAVVLDVWRRMPFAALPFGEDLEWARRVTTAGYRLAFVPRSMVIHSHNRGWRYRLWRDYVDILLIHQLFPSPQRFSFLAAARLTARSARTLLRQWRRDEPQRGNAAVFLSLALATLLRGLAYQAAAARLTFCRPSGGARCAS